MYDPWGMLGAATPFASGLSRPESVQVMPDGSVVTCDRRGGLMHIDGDGRSRLRAMQNPPEGFLPNGFARTPGGEFLIADHGPGGGVWNLQRAEPFLLEVESKSLPSTNFVMCDRHERTWITVSTWEHPRERGLRKSHASGTLILVDRRGARTVADGLGWANEVAMHPSGDWLYLNETVRRRTSRFPINEHGRLGPRETVVEYGEGVYPDGLAFDAEGGLWVASVLSNCLLRVTPENAIEVLFRGTPDERIAEAETAFQNECFNRETFEIGRDFPPYNLTSLAFGGYDGKTIFLGNLADERLWTIRSPIAGFRPAHWHF
jgi:sugar lactone lactonase YvrE